MADKAWRDLSDVEQWRVCSRVIREFEHAARTGVKNGANPIQFNRELFYGYRTMFKMLLGWTEKRIADAREERLKLEARVAILENRPSLRHAGVWSEGVNYNEGNLTTHAGGMWLCQKATKARPSKSDDWQLVVKSGHACSDGNGAERKRNPTGTRR
jgi:hypothetical protein